MKMQYVTEIEVTDPDTKLPVRLSIYKEEAGGMVGLDSSFLANTDEQVVSPYGNGPLVESDEEPAPYEKPRVLIEVSGGVAYVVAQPQGVHVEIKDYDVDGCTESELAEMPKDDKGTPYELRHDE